MPRTDATDLWDDWCKVTGTDPTHRDQTTLNLFTTQVDAPRKLLRALEVRPPASPAPAWPRTLRAPGSLGHVLEHSWRIAEHPQTHWVNRLRLRRLRFAAVLLAPQDQGGLGLDRTRLRALTPTQLQERRASIASTPEAPGCPACAVWTWLQVLSTNNGWSHASVRALAHQPEQLVDHEQLHDRPDPSTDWRTCAGLLPAIDRWGYVDQYESLHPSSVSVLTSQLQDLLHVPAPTTPVPDPDPHTDRPPTRSFTHEEQEQVFARADELNARINKILAEYG